MPGHRSACAKRWGILLLALLALCACERRETLHRGPVYTEKRATPAKRTYVLAVHPLYDPEQLVRRYQPLVEHLSAAIPSAAFTLQASRDYPDYEEKYRRSQPDVLIPNPWQTLEAMEHGYEVRSPRTP